MKPSILAAMTALIALLCAVPLMAQESCAPILTTSSQVDAGAVRDTFSIQKTIDIDFVVQLKKGVVERLKSDGVLELRIFNPRSNLYQSMSVPISVDARNKGTKRKVAGYPLPMDVQILSSVTRGKDTALETSVRLPVAGTSIVRNSMYGAWTAVAFLNGEELKCAKKATFTITR